MRAATSMSDSFYACRADVRSTSVGSLAVHVVSVRPDSGSRNMLLTEGAGPAQVLAPVASANGQLYANAHLAWSASDKAVVLADVDNIQTYTCQRVSYDEAVALRAVQSGS
jgi:membrane-bound inhibitor of C-type lysozyme